MKNKIRSFFLLICFIYIVGCEDLFVRFKYENYECPENSAGIKKIFIKDYEKGDTADVQIDDFLYKFEIIDINEQMLYLKEEKMEYSIKIYRSNDKIEARTNNLILNVKCDKQTFKM